MSTTLLQAAAASEFFRALAQDDEFAAVRWRVDDDSLLLRVTTTIFQRGGRAALEASRPLASNELRLVAAFISEPVAAI